MNLACIGLQFGDEGKGKVVDYLSDQAQWVIRFNGGNNTGCTVVTGGKEFKLHHIPAGIVREKKSVLTPGMVINPSVLMEEIETLEGAGISLKDRLFIGQRTHLISAKHRQADSRQEDDRDQPLGTTRRGIGPCYADKMRRTGMRIVDALDAIDRGETVEYEEELRALRQYVCDTFYLLHRAHKKGDNLLFEGAQGTLLDIDFGTYPYVTSSHTIAANGCTGTGFSPRKIDGILGIAKAYTTRVGTGPFPTEVHDDDRLLKKGKEIGVTTGRLRRCGWQDLFALRYAMDLNDANMLALTKLDILTGFDKIPVCIGYKYKGRMLKKYPASHEVFSSLKPVYREMKGWEEKLSPERELPQAARDYIKFIEDAVEREVYVLSIGADREETILRKEVWT